MEKDELRKRPVMDKLPLLMRILFGLCFVLCTVVFAILAVKNPDLRKTFLIIVACADIVFLLLAYLVPLLLFCGSYYYAIEPDGIALYRKEERVMFLQWDKTEVSVGSYISRGSERSPGTCRRAICFTPSGKMRYPQRFPKRALRGAGGELCIAYSRSRLREVFNACGGSIMSDITADGCRLSESETESMLDELSKLHGRAKRSAKPAAPAQSAPETENGEREKT